MISVAFHINKSSFLSRNFFLVSHQLEALQEQVRVKRRDKGDD